MKAYEKTAKTTPAQDREIEKQVEFYGTYECPCAGLSSYRVYPANEGFGTYPDDSVAVDFTYLHEDGERLGLETTVFAADGTVTDSQDFG